LLILSGSLLPTTMRKRKHRLGRTMLQFPFICIYFILFYLSP
jgi:hypothetical protein